MNQGLCFYFVHESCDFEAAVSDRPHYLSKRSSGSLMLSSKKFLRIRAGKSLKYYTKWNEVNITYRDTVLRVIKWFTFPR